MNRRGFLQSLLAAAIAPAIVKAANLMPVRQLESGVLVFPNVGTFDASALQFTVPEGVNAVWLTCIGGGGGGGGVNRHVMVSPFENAAGEIFNKPIAVRPGEVMAIEVGARGGSGENRHAIVQWIDGRGTLHAQEFVAPPHQKVLELSSRTLYRRNT